MMKEKIWVTETISTCFADTYIALCLYACNNVKVKPNRISANRFELDLISKLNAQGDAWILLGGGAITKSTIKSKF